MAAGTWDGAIAAERRPMEPLDMLKIEQLNNPEVSPDGNWLLYERSVLNWKVGRRFTDIHVSRMDGSGARRMTFTEDKSETGAAWSRGSDAIVFLSDRDGPKRQVYRLPLRGGEARKLSNEKPGVRGFQLSRDGRRLAFLTADPNNRQLKLVDLENPEEPAAKLTSHATSVGPWLWHPDSKRILFAATDEVNPVDQKRKKAGFDVKINAEEQPASNFWSIDIESKDEKQITEHKDRRPVRIRLSRDGKYLAYTAESTDRFATFWNWEVFLLDIDAGTTRRITNNRQQETSVRFSPDSAWLAYVGPDRGEQYRAAKIYLVPTAGGEERKLLEGWDYDGSVSFWAPDSQAIYFAPTLGLNRQMMRVSISGGAPEQVTSGEHFASTNYDHDANKLVLRRSTPTEPDEFFTAELAHLGASDQWTQLTDSDAQVDELQLGTYERVRWKSTDGGEVEGILVKPVDYEEGKRYPLVVQIHGGPASTSTNMFPTRWSTYVHVFAGKGYAVFQPNYRGSSGYGESFRREIAGDYFRQGFEDIMSGVDHLIDQGIADPDKLVHMGWSAGGHWSNWALTHTDRFKAIASGAGAVNWISMWAQSDMQINREFYFDGKPYDNRDHYLQVSPLTYIKNAKTPTLIMCGTNDNRVPNPQSRELYLNLQKLGVPVEYIEFPGMPHGITKPRYQLVKMHAELAWFDKWLNGKEEWLDWEELLATIPGKSTKKEKKPGVSNGGEDECY
jgi:dipeptidyl aminopeptidase/acylaminoacyl peptidase